MVEFIIPFITIITRFLLKLPSIIHPYPSLKGSPFIQMVFGRKVGRGMRVQCKRSFLMELEIVRAQFSGIPTCCGSCLVGFGISKSTSKRVSGSQRGPDYFIMRKVCENTGKSGSESHEARALLTRCESLNFSMP